MLFDIISIMMRRFPIPYLYGGLEDSISHYLVRDIYFVELIKPLIF